MRPGRRRAWPRPTIGLLVLVGGLALVAGRLPAWLGSLSVPLGLGLAPVAVLIASVLLCLRWADGSLSAWGRNLSALGCAGYFGTWVVLAVAGDIEGGIPTPRQEALLGIWAAGGLLTAGLLVLGGVLVLALRPSVPLGGEPAA